MTAARDGDPWDINQLRPRQTGALPFEEVESAKDGAPDYDGKSRTVSIVLLIIVATVSLGALVFSLVASNTADTLTSSISLWIVGIAFSVALLLQLRFLFVVGAEWEFLTQDQRRLRTRRVVLVPLGLGLAGALMLASGIVVYIGAVLILSIIVAALWAAVS